VREPTGAQYGEGVRLYPELLQDPQTLGPGAALRGLFEAAPRVWADFNKAGNGRLELTIMGTIRGPQVEL
jgi:hypothetical protein